MTEFDNVLRARKIDRRVPVHRILATPALRQRRTETKWRTKGGDINRRGTDLEIQYPNLPQNRSSADSQRYPMYDRAEIYETAHLM